MKNTRCWGLRFLPALALGLAAALAQAAPVEKRPALKGVTSYRLGNYGVPSVTAERREQVAPVVAELNALRAKAWSRSDARMSCYATLILSGGGKMVGYFRISPDYVVERPLEKGEPSYSLAVTPADIPLLTRLLAEITPPKCK